MGNSSVLLVDNEPAVLRTTELILQISGYTVSTAENAENACKLLQALRFDLLLLDSIPNYEWLVKYARRASPQIRIVALTGNCEIDVLPEAELVLHKPLSPHVLLKTVANLVRTPSVG